MITHLTKKDRKDITQAKTFKELAKVALRILHSVPYPLVQVCGSITTGGGTRKQNMRRFALAIDRLSKSGVCVFSQLPFEEELYRLAQGDAGKAYCFSILEEFYLPIFESGKIQRAYFLSGWQKSIGATWEHEVLSGLGIEIWTLPEGVWHDRNISY